MIVGATSSPWAVVGLVAGLGVAAALTWSPLAQRAPSEPEDDFSIERPHHHG